MSISGFIIGILTSILFFISNYMYIVFYDYVFSLMRWFNYLNMVFALIGFILCLLGTLKGERQVFGIIGVLLCTIITILSFLECKGIIIVNNFPISGLII